MKRMILFLLSAVCILLAESSSLKENQSDEKAKSKEKKSEYKPFQTDAKGFQTVSKEAIQEWKKTRRVALVAGSGDYLPNSKLSRLHFTSDDSHKMATVLRNVGQFDEIVLLNDEEGKLDSSRSAKKENILREFRRLLKTDPKTFLFYFSGHGFQLDRENVVAPVNADLTKKSSERNMLNVSKEIIDAAKFYKKLDKERKDSLEDADSEIPPDEKDGVPQIMVFLDACRDNLEEGKGGTGGLQSFTDFTLSSRLKNAKGVGVFLGTAPGEKSYEIKELNSGLFTHFLLEGISGGVQDRGVEYVTFNDLKLYVQEQMKAYSMKTGNKEQIPYSTGDYTGDFLVAVGRPAGKMKLDAVQYKFEGTERTDAKRAYDENGKILRLSFHNIQSTGDVIPSSLQEISRISIKYNEKCFENNGIQYGSRRADFAENCMTALQYDRQGNLDFQHGIRYIPDTGWEITRPYLDETATKNAVRDTKAEGGIQYQRIIFDFNGNPILNEYHGENRKDLKQEKTVETLLADKEGIARIVQNFDVFSNKTLEEYYDAEKKLKPNADGIARKVFAYDSKGNPILELYMDEFSEQKKIYSGWRNVPNIYKTAYVYDYSVNEYGIIKSKRQYGKTEDIFVEGEDGLAKYEYEYSPDCLKFYSRTKEDARHLNCIQSVSYRGRDGKYKGNDRNIALNKFTYNENGLLTGEEYFRSSELPMVIRNGITKITYRYSEDCLNLLEPKLRTLKCRETDADCMKKEKLVNTCVNEISTFNSSGMPESDFDGVATYKYRYDKGCLIYIADKERCITIESALDMKGNVVPVPKERKEEQFDENCLSMGHQVDECRTQVVFYGKDGRLRDDKGIARFARRFDEKGNLILYETYGVDGKLIARHIRKYDQHCLKAGNYPNDCITLYETYWADGQLKADENGMARHVRKYDEHCLKVGNDPNDCRTLYETYGADGQLKADENGIARPVRKYDEHCLKAGKRPKDCKTLYETYGADGKLKADEKGIARYFWKYDENCLKADKLFDKCRTLYETYGADGQLKADQKGIARSVYEYDEKGNQILEESYGADGKLKADGTARFVCKYDENGKKISEEKYGAGGQLNGGSEGIARSVYKYDEKGNPILMEYYGADGHLKADRTERYVYKYDENGKKISEEKYGAGGQLNGGSDGIARFVYKYDEKGNPILIETYGADDQLKADQYGTARFVCKYDEKGHTLFYENYGADGKLNGGSDVIARFVCKYDEAGNKILEEYYGADGKLTADGTARFVYKYDEKGNPIQIETYGADEKLKADGYGIARYVNKYNEKGNKTLAEHYGADGKLKADGYGIARYVNKYNEKGNKTLAEHYGADGKLRADGTARFVSMYDKICSSNDKEHQEKNEKCKSYEEHSDSEYRITSVTKRIFDSEGNYVKDEDMSHLIGTKKWTAAEDRFAFSEKMKDITEKELVLEDGKQVEKEKKYSVITNASYSVQFPNPRGADGKKTVTVELDRFYRPGRVKFE